MSVQTATIPFPAIETDGMPAGRARLVFPGGHIEEVETADPMLSLDAIGILKLRMSEWMLANGFGSLAEVVADPSATAAFHATSATVYLPNGGG